AGKRKEWLDALRSRVFGGWPSKPVDLASKPAADIKHQGLRLRAFDFTSEEGIELRLWLLTAAKVDKPTLVVLSPVDQAGWQEFLQEMGPAFKDALLVAEAPKLSEARFQQNLKALEHYKWAFATLAPRGIGPTRWTGNGTAVDNHIRRRFP